MIHALGVFLAATVVLSVPAAAADTALETLKTANEAIAAADDAKAATLIDALLDYPSMAEAALPGVEDAYKARYLAAFTRIARANYLKNRRASAGKSISYSVEEVSKEKSVVKTVENAGSSKSDEDTVDYKMDRVGGVWKVSDRVVNEVSYVMVAKSQYGKIRKNEGIEALIAKLEAKAEHR